MLIRDILISNAHRYPNKLALVDGNHKISWKELNDRVNRVSHGLLDLGLSKGDRIAVISESCHQYLELLFASTKIGVMAVCLNYRFSPEQLSRMIKICEPRGIIVQNKLRDNIEVIRSELSYVEKFIGLGDGHGYPIDFESLVSKSSHNEPITELNEDDGYAICFSSGTTGEPKAALITHRNRITNCIQTSLAHSATRNNIILLPFALYTSVLQQYLFSYAFVGATLVIINFTPKDYLEAIEREKADTIMINYTLFKLTKEYLEKSERSYDLHSVKMVRSAGQVLSYEQWKEVLEFFHFPQLNKGFAMTEAGMVISGIPEEYREWLVPNATAEEKRKFNSLGKTLMEEEMKVGPKGQVVIPKAIRKALKITPGSKVVFKLEDDRLILEKPSFDAVAVFRKLSQQINYNEKINPHQYEEELEERTS